MKKVESSFAVPDPFDVALVLARDPHYIVRVERTSGDAGDAADAALGPLEHVAKRAPLVDLLAGLIVWCRGIAPKLPAEEVLGRLTALFVLLLLLIFVQSAASIELDVARNRLVVKIPFGPSDDLRKKFGRAKREAKALLPQLRGHRAPSRGPARHARSRYLAVRALSRRMSAPALAEHWYALTSAWSKGSSPRGDAQEWDAFREWQPKGEPEKLDLRNLRRALRGQRERLAAAEQSSVRPDSDAEPSITLDEPPGRGVATFTVGSDDFGDLFREALDLAKAHQRRLLGYRAPSRGRARPARSTYHAYRHLAWNEGPTTIATAWHMKHTTAWFERTRPEKGAPEGLAYREWKTKRRKLEPLELLEPTQVAAGLRAWRAHNAALERANRLTPDVGGGGSVS